MKAPLKNKINDPDIYSVSGKGHFYSPFSFSIDKMEHLILINFEKDPDKYYNTFELQQATTENNEKRLLVIAYRIDGKCDIYHQPDYPFGSQAIILNSPAFFVEPMQNAVFDIDAENLKVAFSFEDRYGRQICVQVTENRRSEKKPFFLLAPIGEAAKAPSTFPVYSLYEMSFTKRKNTDIIVVIEDKKHKPDTFFLPIDWARNYFTRYSADTFNIDWNKNTNAALSPLEPDDQNRVYDGDTTYDVLNTDGCWEIKQMSTRNKKHEITIEFSPAVADIACLKNDIEIKGDFKISTDGSQGSITGEYSIKKDDNQVSLQLQPGGGWQPNEKRQIIKLLYNVVKVFRMWPASYIWNATVSFEVPEKPFLNSSWKRITTPVQQS